MCRLWLADHVAAANLNMVKRTSVAISLKADRLCSL